MLINANLSINNYFRTFYLIGNIALEIIGTVCDCDHEPC
jgi:hypothetical protein